MTKKYFSIFSKKNWNDGKNCRIALYTILYTPAEFNTVYMYLLFGRHEIREDCGTARPLKRILTSQLSALQVELCSKKVGLHQISGTYRLPDIRLKKLFKIKDRRQIRLQQNIYQRDCLSKKSGPILFLYNE